MVFDNTNTKIYNGEAIRDCTINKVAEDTLRYLLIIIEY